MSASPIAGSSFLCHLTVCPLKEHPAAKVSLILLNFDNPAERSKKSSGTSGSHRLDYLTIKKTYSLVKLSENYNQERVQ